ncbi:hypothetical protein PHJA_002684500 [Phtheirospermum japonicum]|uniref:Uncharacterized protein n=1 Tax=Phtheirospermum japonicum TaxID=374723 RepID=A0A830DBB4_9LAMI|nr:hypothetical protein PHJA_002684500 [Phtheirospermum japonicum]
MELNIKYKKMEANRREPGSYKHATSTLSDCESRSERRLSILSRDSREVFEFLKLHQRPYLLNPYLLNNLSNINVDDVLVEDAMSYEAWLDTLKRHSLVPRKSSKSRAPLVGPEKWNVVKKHLDEFSSLLKAHKDGFRIRPDATKIFLCVERDKNGNFCVQKYRPFNEALQWFWSKVKDFLVSVDCLNLAPANFRDFVVQPKIYSFANDCPYFWTPLRKANYILEFSQCIVEDRFDRTTLSQCMNLRDLDSWVDTLKHADKSKYGRLQELLYTPGCSMSKGMSNQERRSFIKEENLKYRCGAHDLVVFFRDALIHYCHYDRTKVAFTVSRVMIVELMEELFDSLFFKLWLAVGDYFDITQPRDDVRDDILRKLSKIGYH